MITQANYLDIGNLLINELVGSVWLFIAIAIILVIYAGVKYSFDLKTTGALIMVVGLGISGYYYQQEVLVIMALIVSFIIYLVMSKIINR